MKSKNIVEQGQRKTPRSTSNTELNEVSLCFKSS